jgi:hypothetical protein
MMILTEPCSRLAALYFRSQRFSSDQTVAGISWLAR